MSAVRGVRGATTARANDAVAITDATLELLRVLRDRNAIKSEDIGYIWFTVTPDLDAAFPADAARVGMGWTDVPLICGREIPVPGALGLCIRVLIAWNTNLAQRDVKHAFMRGARVLRPAWAVDLLGEKETR
ncbi:MAG TPA: chorismate mutase [Methylomirabilota bacterium]|nr:chorismate mutase [Methylomirabilota bacterium]